MQPLPGHVDEKVRESMDTWHRMVMSRDVSGVAAIARPDAVFRSPMAHSPYISADALQLVLSTVIQVFENFTYHRQFASDDGLGVVLEFSANVSGRDLKGIDMIRFDSEGKIAEFEVMVRPLSGLKALGDEMGRRLGGVLPDFKA